MLRVAAIACIALCACVGGAQQDTGDGDASGDGDGDGVGAGDGDGDGDSGGGGSGDGDGDGDGDGPGDGDGDGDAATCPTAFAGCPCGPGAPCGASLSCLAGTCVDADGFGDDAVSCDRFAGPSCPQDQKCVLLLRRAVDQDASAVYAGCVHAAVPQTAIDAHCSQWSIDYDHPNTDDVINLDPCAPGLHCAPRADDSGLYACQRACQSGRYQGIGQQLCAGHPGEYCSSAEANPFLEHCVLSAGCDPSDPLACADNQGCFLRLGDAAPGATPSVLSECYPAVPSPLADGMLCQFVNDCAPGSVCWGPAIEPASQWAAPNILCRRACTPGLVDDCPPGTACIAVSDSGADVSSIDVAVGQCE